MSPPSKLATRPERKEGHRLLRRRGIDAANLHELLMRVCDSSVETELIERSWSVLMV